MQEKCNIYIDSVSFIQMLWPETLLVSCNILGNKLTLNRNPNLNYQPKPVLSHNTGFNFLMPACRIKEQARKICTTLTNMVGGWKYFWKNKWWSQPILMVTKYFFNNIIIQQISKSICFGFKNNFIQFQPSLRLVFLKFWPNNFSLLSPLYKVFLATIFKP